MPGDPNHPIHWSLTPNGLGGVFTCLVEGVEELTDKLHPNLFYNAEEFFLVDVDVISGYIQAPIKSLEVLIVVLED